MEEMIRVKGASYARYEELLLRRDQLKKDAFQYQQDYIREFGSLILELFELKMEGIRKKKTIEYCQAALNHGKTVDPDALKAFLERELASFKEKLEEMIREKEAADDAKPITAAKLLKIKRIYHKLVKKIHPDINPRVKESKTLEDLWHQVALAYNCNDLELLQELEVLVESALEQLGEEGEEIDIPDIDERIEKLEHEISVIIETDPYQYKYLLDDEDLIEEKKQDLRDEIRSYQDYLKTLEEVLEDLMHRGVKITWQTS